jgi:hypothetical protein
MNNRRQALKTSFAAGSAFSILPSLLRGETAPSNRVNIAMIGTGRQGISRNMRTFLGMDNVCELADIEVPEYTEGISFKPVLKGEKDQVRDVLYGVYCGGTKPGMRCVKKGDWKLIKYDVLDGTVRETQLFNLAENPDELLKEHHAPEVVAFTGNQPKPNQVNLADDPKYADKLAEMEALLLSEQKRLDDPYRLWDQSAE